MSQNIRTFIAIKIKPGVELLNLINRCRNVFQDEDIKWVEENNLHLTLKFLGETSEIQVLEVKNILENIGARYSGFSFSLNGLGYFKSQRQPRVLFVGISDFKQMKIIAGELEDKLTNIGFEKETREFKPHLTLARIKFLKEKRRFFQFVDGYKNFSFQRVIVSEIIFYQSILRPEGPVYQPIKTFQLK